jgi:hypothetical protein
MLIAITLGHMEDVRDLKVSGEKAIGLTFATMVSIMNAQKVQSLEFVPQVKMQIVEDISTGYSVIQE